MANRLQALCLLCLSCCGPAFGQDSDAKNLYNQKRYETARARAEEEAGLATPTRWWCWPTSTRSGMGSRRVTPKASAGICAVAVHGRFLYGNGRGVDRDSEEAAGWYR